LVGVELKNQCGFIYMKKGMGDLGSSRKGESPKKKSETRSYTDINLIHTYVYDHHEYMRDPINTKQEHESEIHYIHSPYINRIFKSLWTSSALVSVGLEPIDYEPVYSVPVDLPVDLVWFLYLFPKSRKFQMSKSP
jgi:hypothetical protein